jgi:nicotinate-nucleotide pyrophosphorylase
MTIEREDIEHHCLVTGNAVAECGIVFRESGMFSGSISFSKIEALFGVNTQTLCKSW